VTKPNEDRQYKQRDPFDVLAGNLHDLPTVSTVKPTTIMGVVPLLGDVQTVIVETKREAEHGDYIFLQVVDARGAVRIVLPPKAADAIARQRDALGAKARREVGKRLGKAMAARLKETGELPAFMKDKKKPKGEAK